MQRVPVQQPVQQRVMDQETGAAGAGGKGKTGSASASAMSAGGGQKTRRNLYGDSTELR